MHKPQFNLALSGCADHCIMRRTICRNELPIVPDIWGVLY